MFNLLEWPFRTLGQIGPRLIMIAAMVTSYTTQRDLFLSWEVEPLTAHVAPGVVDILAITCAEILHDQYVIRGKRWAGIVLAIAGGGSMAANWIAGATMGSKVVHAGMVLAYVLAELVVGTVKRRSVAAAKAEAMQELVVDLATAPALGGAPEKKAAATKRPGVPKEPYGPRDPEKGYSRRSQTRMVTGK